jgi:uncharacterized protein YggU (UPF0235/DUF167 family)
MSTLKFHLHDSKGGSALAVRITPRAAKNEIAEIMRDGTVRVRLTAAKNEAINQALVEFLASILNISPTQIEVVAGAAGKDKLVSILNMDAETVHKTILTFL